MVRSPGWTGLGLLSQVQPGGKLNNVLNNCNMACCLPLIEIVVSLFQSTADGPRWTAVVVKNSFY